MNILKTRWGGIRISPKVLRKYWRIDYNQILSGIHSKEKNFFLVPWLQKVAYEIVVSWYYFSEVYVERTIKQNAPSENRTSSELTDLQSEIPIIYPK